MLAPKVGGPAFRSLELIYKDGHGAQASNPCSGYVVGRDKLALGVHWPGDRAYLVRFQANVSRILNRWKTFEGPHPQLSFDLYV